MRRGRDLEVHLRVTEFEGEFSYMRRVAEPIEWIPKGGIQCILLDTAKVRFSPRLEVGMKGVLISGWRRVKRCWGRYNRRGLYAPVHPEQLLDTLNGTWVDYTYRVYIPNLDMTYSMLLRDLGGKKGALPWRDFRLKGAKFAT